MNPIDVEPDDEGTLHPFVEVKVPLGTASFTLTRFADDTVALSADIKPYAHVNTLHYILTVEEWQDAFEKIGLRLEVVEDVPFEVDNGGDWTP